MFYCPQLILFEKSNILLLSLKKRNWLLIYLMIIKLTFKVIIIIMKLKIKWWKRIEPSLMSDSASVNSISCIGSQEFLCVRNFWNSFLSKSKWNKKTWNNIWYSLNKKLKFILVKNTNSGFKANWKNSK